MSECGYPRFWNLNLGSVQTIWFILFYFTFCMRLISLYYQENCVWPSLKCHTTRLHPLIRGRRVSLPRALHRLQGGDERHFRLPMDIYVHPGIIKGGIQRKHISILWVGKEE